MQYILRPLFLKDLWGCFLLVIEAKFVENSENHMHDVFLAVLGLKAEQEKEKKNLV